MTATLGLVEDIVLARAAKNFVMPGLDPGIDEEAGLSGDAQASRAVRRRPVLIGGGSAHIIGATPGAAETGG